MANGEKVEAVKDFIFFGSKITEDGACIQEIKRCLLLGKNKQTNKQTMTNLDRVLKNRDINLPTKVHIVKAMFFFFFSSVVMYRCESWTIKNTE